MRFVEIDEASVARGLRMIVAGGLPSPWSRAAMGIFDLKQIDYLAVRFRPVAQQAVRSAVPPSLVRHRDLIYQRHLVLPVRF